MTCNKCKEETELIISIFGVTLVYWCSQCGTLVVRSRYEEAVVFTPKGQIK